MLNAQNSRYVRGLLIWFILWILAFAVNGLLLQFGFVLHEDYRSTLLLALRDLTVLAIAFWLWKRSFPNFYGLQNWRLQRWDWMLLSIALGFTALYYVWIVRWGESSSKSPVIVEQLLYHTPLRIVSLISFQQVLSNFFLLDVHRQRFGDKRGLLIAATVFGLSHLLGVFIQNPSIYALLITPASFLGLLCWGYARIFWKSPWLGFIVHYTFYIQALLGKAWGWY